MSTPKDFAKRLRDLVRGARGDDLERANYAFQGATEAQLDEEHGQSGRTRREVWDDYKRRREEDNALYAFTDKLLKDSGL